jgi:hypothetical protein
VYRESLIVTIIIITFSNSNKIRYKAAYKRSPSQFYTSHLGGKLLKEEERLEATLEKKRKAKKRRRGPYRKSYSGGRQQKME